MQPAADRLCKSTAARSRCSDHLSSDPVLSYIASRLASGKPTSGLTGSSQSPLIGAGSSGSAGSSNIPGLAEWQVDWNNIKLERQIGRGAYGRVYSGHWSGIQVAVKVLITKESFEDELEGEGLQLPESVQKELQVEAMTLSRLRHPCCVTFYGICELPPAILTVKSPNLLVDSHWRCKVADFNLSKILAGGQQPVASSGGAPLNPTWLAPEVLAGEQATMASDAFSFGYVLWELLTWRLPWSGVQPFVVMKLVRNGSRPDIPPLDQLPGPSPAGCPGMDDYMQLIRDCWAQDPAQRPSFASIAPRLHVLLEQLDYGAAEV
ncbi:hypothetical protein COHA_004194 [Chlorella ohadii]|uniref:Protein kinase domain-containing protein n=1 Tax=Chlorella ohadii TaxID=2649997 RepID=A0AAD5DR25_9CHLO|nr:hypothetical protein COHA_004194 [Chlorella ohadii]